MTSVNNINEIIVENISYLYIKYTLILCVKAIANGEFFIVQLLVAKFKRKPIIATIVILITNSLLYKNSNLIAFYKSPEIKLNINNIGHKFKLLLYTNSNGPKLLV